MMGVDFYPGLFMLLGAGAVCILVSPDLAIYCAKLLNAHGEAMRAAYRAYGDTRREAMKNN